MACSAAMRRIQRSDLMDMAQTLGNAGPGGALRQPGRLQGRAARAKRPPATRDQSPISTRLASLIMAAR